MSIFLSRLLAGLFMLGVCLPPAEAQNTEVSEELCVMSFNLRYKGGDRAPHDWDNRLPLALEQIAEERPHIIGTQEGLFSQVQDLERGLEGFRWVGQGRNGGSRGEYMAIFYDTTRLALLEYDHYWLSDTPDRVGSKSFGNGVVRMTTWARFKDLSSGKSLVVVNTHFDHQVEKARVRSAQLMRDRDPDLKSETVLGTGDFNCAADRSTAWKILVEDGPYKDTWNEAEQTANDVGTFHGWGPPRPDSSRIDWILYRGRLRILSAKVCTYGRDQRWPSDHFPVVARVRVL